MGVSAVLLACSMSGRAASEELINAGTIKEAPATESSSTTELTTDVSSEAPTTTSPDAVIVDSDKIELYLDRKMRAIGNASISQNNKTILGDTIDYDVQNDQLDVKGNAQINVGNAKLTGPALNMQLSDDVGEMKDASITLYKPARANKDQLITICLLYTSRCV